MEINSEKIGPKISIITVCYNSERYIEEAIKSVLMQTYNNIEYIVIDGKSDDGTLGIIKKYHDKIDYMISEPDSGIYEAFNKGVRASTGDIIYFLNSDDYLIDEDSIAKAAKVFMDNSELKIVYGNVLIVNDSFKSRYIFGREMGLEDFRKGCMPPHQGTFVKKELFEVYGLFDEAYEISGDFEFMLRCFLDGMEGIKYINETIAVFREGGKSTDYRYGKIRDKETGHIIRKYLGDMKGLDEDKCKTNPDALCRLWLEFLLLNGKGITGRLRDNGIKDVAIFGTRKIALCLYNDLKKENFNIVRFLDNNTNMHGQEIYGTLVEAPEWLAKNHPDAVIVSIESDHDAEVIKQLYNITEGKMPIISWKDLIMKQP
ncbi:MAG TPA: glycosyltransferase [Bacillota bacterium]|nr:glycosyltransferase [Bacillota bacterium]